MWVRSAGPWSTIAETAAGIGHLAIMLILVPIAGLIYIARLYLSLARIIAVPTEGLPRTADTMDEDAQS